MIALIRRQHEGGLRKVHLPRDGLHRVVADAVCLEHHRELIARERPLGEDVDNPNRVTSYGN